METDAQWNTQDYNWHPYNVVASAANGAPEPAGPNQPLAQTVGQAAIATIDFTAQLASINEQADQDEEAILKARSSHECQVEGCFQDLTVLKEYHQRYKICERHLKMSEVFRDGSSKRFCQQCGRFHELKEFDGDKRSCRSRLERHNARRRKKEELEGTVKPQGIKKRASTKRWPFSTLDDAQKEAAAHEPGSPQLPPPQQQNGIAAIHKLLPHPAQKKSQLASGTGTAQQQNLGAAVKSMLATQPAAPNESNEHYPGVDVSAIYSLLRGPWSSPLGVPYGDHPPIAEPPSSSNPDRTSLSEALQAQMQQQWQQQQQQQQHQQQQQQQQQRLIETHPLHSSGGVANSALYGNATSELVNGKHAPFRPQPSASTIYTAATPTELQKLLEAGPVSELRPVGKHQRKMAAHPVVPTSVEAVISEAANLLLNGGYNQQYESDEILVRISAKCAPGAEHLLEYLVMRPIFNCIPSQLPFDIRNQIEGIIDTRDKRSLEAFIRPGCVFLTVDTFQDISATIPARGAGLRATLERLLDGNPSGFWTTTECVVQLEGEAALLRGGKVEAVLNLSDSAAMLPRLTGVCPIAVLAGDAGTVISISGSYLGGGDVTMSSRMHGFYVEEAVELEGVETDEGVEECQMLLPGQSRSGVLRLEAVSSALLSAPRPLAVMHSRQAVAELRQLECDVAAGADVDGLLNDLGCVLAFCEELTDLRAGVNTDAPRRSWTEADMRRIARMARKLLTFAAGKGWPAVARAVLPAAAADCGSIGGAIRLLQAQSQAAGMDAMQLATCSGSSAMVDLLSRWAAAGHSRWSAPDAGLTDTTQCAAAMHTGAEDAVMEGCRPHASTAAAQEMCALGSAIC